MATITSRSGDDIDVRLTAREYILVMTGLREVGAELCDAELSARMGATRAELSALSSALHESGFQHGIEE
jgi:hypothetical protein